MQVFRGEKLEIGKQLKLLRNNRGITQCYLANELYVSVQTINKWENGKCLPDAINLLNISQFYGVSLDILMNNEIPKKMKVSRKKSILTECFNIFKKKKDSIQLKQIFQKKLENILQTKLEVKVD